MPSVLFRVKNLDGAPLIKIVLNEKEKYEFYLLSPFKNCYLGEFDNLNEAEVALGQYYGFENIEEVRS
ncbi:hypothetical protein [Lactobacillus crispatus]|uniref:hypothetical protein n=1 Tax=Lactobacillus crispatus TaxID=47770 RepID=UPI001F09FD65|nr:hypothetical protein [Lactobacillus crispatus]